MPCKSDPAAAASDIDLFRESMARLAATVSIVTAELRGRRHGTTITAAMSLSLDPISILLSLHRGSATCAAIIETRKLCINLLGPDHNELAQRFAVTSGHHGDARFDAGDWHGAPGEPPMLRDASAVLQCDLAETHALGTHVCCARCGMFISVEIARHSYMQTGNMARLAARPRPRLQQFMGYDMVETAPAFYKIFVTDLDRAIDFYTVCLGFRDQRRIDAGAFEEVVLTPAKKGASLVLCRWKDGRKIARGDAQGPTGYFLPDVDAVTETMTDRDASIILGPVDFSGMRIAVLADPDGHQIELLETKSRKILVRRAPASLPYSFAGLEIDGITDEDEVPAGIAHIRANPVALPVGRPAGKGLQSVAANCLTIARLGLSVDDQLNAASGDSLGVRWSATTATASAFC